MPWRILIDVRHLADFGVGTYIRNLIWALSRLDAANRYFLISAHEKEKDLEGLPENFQLIPYGRSDVDPWDQWAFPVFLKNFGADLYHIPLGRVPLFMPKPYVVTVHDLSNLLWNDTGPRWAQLLWEYRVRRGFARAARVITVSNATRRDVIELLDVPPEKIRRVYNAPDPFYFEHAETLDDARAAEREKEQRLTLARYQIQYPFVLYAGTIRPQKNIPRLVEAFSVARRDLQNHPVYNDLRLIIIGDEISRYPTVRQAVIESRVEPFVRFLGFVPLRTLRVFYESAAAFLFPSLYEGFGLPPLEAMACGTPVVASNVSSLPEVVGDAALLVSPENVFEIARAIREVLCDEQLRADLIRKGAARVRLFSWDNTAREVLSIYQEVLAERLPSR